MTSQGIKKTLIIPVASAAVLLFGATAHAQQPDAGEPAAQPQVPQPAAIEVSDEQVATFVKAQEAIGTIGAEWQGKIEAMSDPEEIRGAQEAAHQEMVAAVEATGISVEDFNRIAQAAQSDRALQQRISELQ